LWRIAILDRFDSSITHDHYTRLQRQRGAMNPESKLLLDELDKRFAAADKRFDGLERQIQTNNDSASTSIKALE
jgi:hypothetical protein